MKIIIYILLAVGGLYGEPSAFMAGNLNSPNPYGLTKDEQYIWQNKQAILKLQKIIQSQSKLIKIQSKTLKQYQIQFLNTNLKINNLSQRLDGMQTMLPTFDKMNLEISNLKQELNVTNTTITNVKKEVNILKDEIGKIKSIVNNNKKTNEANTQTIISLVENLAKNIDKMQMEITKLNKKVDFKTWENSKIYHKAVSLFRVSNFTKAQEMFNYLYLKHYKLPTILFYLGEIEYKRGNYKSALSYYKKSIQISSKPSFFMDELLYHTGYSFEKLGNLENAKKSYQKLINDFPKSILVKYAKKRLENLEKNR